MHRPSYGPEPARGEFFGVCDAVSSWIDLTFPRPTRRPIWIASWRRPRLQGNALSLLLTPEQLGDERGARRIPLGAIQALTVRHRN